MPTEYDEMRAKFARHGYEPMFDTLLKRGVALDEMDGHLLGALGTGRDARPLTDTRMPGEHGAPALHTQAREYSLTRIIAAEISGDRRSAGYEYEINDELRNRGDKKYQGLAVPAGAFAKRAPTLSGDVPGVLPTDHMDGLFIDSLKPHVVCAKMGARMATGFTANAVLPKLTDPMAGQWVNENEAPADSILGAGNVPVSLHQLTSTTVLSRKIILQSAPYMEDIVRSDGRRTIAAAVDYAAIAGSGIGPEPRGLLNTAGIGLVGLGDNGDALAWADVVNLRAAVMAENIVGNSFGYVTNHHVEAKLLTTERAAGTARFIMDDAAPDRLAGYPVGFSSNVPANLAKGTGTNLSALIFGNWSDMMIAQFGGIDVIVDPYTESAKGNVRITLHSGWDIAVRYPESFAAIRDIVTA